MGKEQFYLPLDERFKNRENDMRVPRQLPLALGRQMPFSVDNYIISSSNRNAFEMLESWPYWPVPVTVLVGGAKTGKSHLAAIWAAQAFAVECIKTHLDKALELAALGTPILLEDVDSGFIDETQLFHLINTVRQAWGKKKQAALLMTARKRPPMWNITLADLASRLRAVNLVNLVEADDTLRRAVLMKLFADRQLLVENDVISFILNRGERSFAKLARTVEMIDNLTLERKSKISRPLAAEVLANLQEKTAIEDKITEKS